MPAIPIEEYRQRTSAQGPLGTTERMAGQGLVALSRGLADVANVFNDRREEDAAAEAALLLARTQSDWQRKLLERQETAEPGAPEFTPTLLKDYDTDTGEILKVAKTRRAKQHLQTRLAEFRGQLGNAALGFEAEARVSHRKGQALTAIDEAATAAELAPEHYQQRAAEQLAVIDVLPLSPIERDELRKSAVELISTRAAVAYARRDPDDTHRRLIAPEEGDTLFRSLSPQQRDAVLKEADAEQRSRLESESRAYTAEQRVEKADQDEVSKEGDQLLARGAMGPRWIESNRDRMSAEDYRYFYRALSGEGDAPRNPMLYADLAERAGLGQDVRDEARAALQRGQIKVGDFDRIRGEVEQQRPGWYKRGVEFISTSAAVSDLNPDPAAAQRKAEMIDNWGDWARQNPKASDEDARQAYKRIVREFAIVDSQKFTLTKRAPRFLVGTRNAPDIDATDAATVRARDEGLIDEAEFQRQALLLKEWREALTKAAETP